MIMKAIILINKPILNDKKRNPKNKEMLKV